MSENIEKIDDNYSLEKFVNKISNVLNEEFDKMVTVTGRTTEGEPLQVAHFTITQLGLREKFLVSNGDEFACSNNELYGVLKIKK